MTAFLQQYISPALPVILWLFRGVTAGLAVWLLVRCCKSLFRGRDRRIPMPFGPFLATAGWIALLWGEAINRAYLNWLGL